MMRAGIEVAPVEAEALLGMPISRKPLAAITHDSILAIERKSPPVVFACANPHSIVVAQHDDNFQSALTQANLVVADGVGVSFMARMVGVQIGPLIPGTNYFQPVLALIGLGARSWRQRQRSLAYAARHSPQPAPWCWLCRLRYRVIF